MRDIIFTPTAICAHCDLEIMLVDGWWVDRLIEELEVDKTFAAACGEGAEYHEPLDEA